MTFQIIHDLPAEVELRGVQRCDGLFSDSRRGWQASIRHRTSRVYGIVTHDNLEVAVTLALAECLANHKARGVGTLNIQLEI